jgi:hypothetical protein
MAEHRISRHQTHAGTIQHAGNVHTQRSSVNQNAFGFLLSNILLYFIFANIHETDASSVILYFGFSFHPNTRTTVEAFFNFIFRFQKRRKKGTFFFKTSLHPFL